MNFRFSRNLDGGNHAPAIGRFKVAASQDLKRGDVVKLASGAVTKGGTALGEVLGVMAQASASQAANTLVEVWIAQPSQTWWATASADASALVLNGTKTYDLNASQQVNIADTTGGSVQIIAIDAASNTTIEVQLTDCALG